MKIFIKFYQNLSKIYSKIIKIFSKFEKKLTKKFKVVKKFVQNLFKICSKFVQIRNAKYHINNILTKKNRAATARRPRGDRTATEPYIYIYKYIYNNNNIINIIPEGIIEFPSEIQTHHFLIKLGELKWNY